MDLLSTEMEQTGGAGFAGVGDGDQVGTCGGREMNSHLSGHVEVAVWSLGKMAEIGNLQSSACTYYLKL